ncbi:MAG: AAA family ATPase [Acidobacteria bacterium]|nr:AAA family ATPase [Acidobacteriota bacterium]
MLTSLRVKNFKSLDDVEIELGKTVVFVGPNNSGKTTALQALALWEIGLRKWLEKRSAREVPEKRPGITINRRDLIAVPVPDANLLWRDLHIRSVQKGRNGKPDTRNIRIDILVSGVTGDKNWECGFEFDYANEESIYCRPLRTSEVRDAARVPVPAAATPVRIAFLPPMSGLAATEDRLDGGAVDVRIGEGRTAEVLRNLCYQLSASEKPGSWEELTRQIQNLFGVELNPPRYIAERGQITMSYVESGGIELDLASSGRGLQQTLLLLAHLYTHPGTVLLLDEPDAHLEILRQRQIYQILTDTADRLGCQVIAASHSEVILEEAADRDVVVAFVGKPHRIDDRGSQVLKSLKAIGFDQYYQAEQTGWVLYLEGSTDLAILRAFAELLGHPARQVLERPFVHYTGNIPPKARDHFFALREAKPDLAGFALFDSDARELRQDGQLVEMKWRRREVENYFCFPETLMEYASNVGGDEGPLFESAERDGRKLKMQEAIREVAAARKTLRQSDPFAEDAKASDDCFAPVFQNYFDKLGLSNLMQKTDYHTLVRFAPLDRLSPEITEKLDALYEVTKRARPVK